MAYAKINSVTNANMAKVSNVAKAALGKIGSIDAPSAAFADGYSLLFDGANDYVDIDSAAGDMPSATGSISYWIKLIGEDSNYIFEIKADANNYIAGAYNTYGEYAWAGTYFGGVWKSSNLGVAQELQGDGKWHHVVMTWIDGSGAGELICYFDGDQDGVQINTITGLGTFSGTPSTFFIGRLNAHGGSPMEGNVNDFAVWSSILTAAEAAAIYNGGTPIDLTTDSGDYVSSGDLVGYWKFEENTGTTVADSSTNSNDGSLVNGTAFEAETP